MHTYKNIRTHTAVKINTHALTHSNKDKHTHTLWRKYMDISMEHCGYIWTPNLVYIKFHDILLYALKIFCGLGKGPIQPAPHIS